MREAVWLYLRSSAPGRWVRAHPRWAGVARRISFWLLPPSHEGLLRVRSGPSVGLLLDLKPRWWVGVWQGSYESAVQQLVASLTGAGSVFYDLGGAVGLYSLLAARRGAAVFVFEPEPGNADCIARHARLNGLEGSVRVVPLAVHSRAGRLLMRRSSRERGYGVAPASSSSPGDGEVLEVGCVSLDEFVASHPVPSLIKIDVEGAESEVLKGARELFERVRPRVICEVHDAENERFVAEWLLERRYRLCWLEAGKRSERFLFGEPQEATERKGVESSAP